MLLLLALLVLFQNLFAIRSDLPMLADMYENGYEEEAAPRRRLIQQQACSNAELCACGAATCCCGAGTCLCSYLTAQGNFVEGVMIAALCWVGVYQSVGECMRDVYLGYHYTIDE